MSLPTFDKYHGILSTGTHVLRGRVVTGYTKEGHVGVKVGVRNASDTDWIRVVGEDGRTDTYLTLMWLTAEELPGASIREPVEITIVDDVITRIVRPTWSPK